MRLPLTLLIGTMCASQQIFAAESLLHAQRDTSISMAQCLSEIDGPNMPTEAQCPGFLIQPLRDAMQTCTEAGGHLTATPQSDLWAIDVNRDGALEYAFEYDGNVACEGAWSVFSCGSLGCSKALYQNHAGAWRVIGEIGAPSPDAIELTDTVVDGYHDLRIGCGEASCNEYAYYHWIGDRYDQTYIEVRGHRVESADSIHGLFGLTGAIDVLAEPTRDAAVLGHYEADTEVAIVGTVKNADYYYVSPCNACDSGFVLKSAVRPLQP